MADHQYPINRETIKKQNSDHAADPTIASPDLENADLVDLQRIIGNQGVQRMFTQDNAPNPPATFIQTKLAVGPADDQYEREADSVANQVMSMPDTTQRQPEEEEPVQTKRDYLQRQEEEEDIAQAKRDDLQRQAEPEEEEEEEEPIQAKRDDLQRQAEEEEEEPIQTKRDEIQRQAMPEEEEELQAKRDIIQRSGMDGGFDVGGDIEENIRSQKGGGQALPAETQSFFGDRFGRDFSGVRVHDNAQSDSLNRSVQARAFTTGKDIFFKQGEYNPGSGAGQTLLAHELTHVIQQNGDEIQRKSSKDKETLKV